MIAEYIWLDGAAPTQNLRSKARVLPRPEGREPCVGDCPQWSFDGSSTYQASGGDSDLLLEPVCSVPDPVRGDGHMLVMCEVLNSDGTPHRSNHRARLRQVLDAGAASLDPWFGFEQEYTLFQDGRPYGWPASGFPGPQGPFYCSVGSSVAWGRKLVENHTQACLKAGLMLYGINAEVMPGQWEFQIGYRGFEGEKAGPLEVADHLWLARWLLMRLGEDVRIDVSWDPKPVSGDWNGAGAHTNFSTNRMREKGGINAIEEAIERLAGAHNDHIMSYGHGLDRRLTGEHETCAIHEFKRGVADRGASIRIPRQVALSGQGYLEDRRPGANCDPYMVCAQILQTVAGLAPSEQAPLERVS